MTEPFYSDSDSQHWQTEVTSTNIQEQFEYNTSGVSNQPPVFSGHTIAVSNYAYSTLPSTVDQLSNHSVSMNGHYSHPAVAASTTNYSQQHQPIHNSSVLAPSTLEQSPSYSTDSFPAANSSLLYENTHYNTATGMNHHRTNSMMNSTIETGRYFNTEYRRPAAPSSWQNPLFDRYKNDTVATTMTTTTNRVFGGSTMARHASSMRDNQRRSLFIRPIEQRPIIIHLYSEDEDEDDEGEHQMNLQSSTKGYVNSSALLEQKQREIMEMRERIAQLEKAEQKLLQSTQPVVSSPSVIDDNQEILASSPFTVQMDRVSLDNNGITANSNGIDSIDSYNKMSTTSPTTMHDTVTMPTTDTTTANGPDKEVAELELYLTQLRMKLNAMGSHRAGIERRVAHAASQMEQYRQYLLMAEHEHRTVLSQLEQQWARETELYNRIEVEQARLDVLRTVRRRKLNTAAVTSSPPLTQEEMEKTQEANHELEEANNSEGELEEGELPDNEPEEGELLPESIDWQPVYDQLDTEHISTEDKISKPQSVASFASSMDISTGSDNEHNIIIDNDNNDDEEGAINDIVISSTTSYKLVNTEHGLITSNPIDPALTAAAFEEQQRTEFQQVLDAGERSLRELREGVELLQRAKLAKSDMMTSSSKESETASNAVTITKLIEALTTESPIKTLTSSVISTDISTTMMDILEPIVTPLVFVGGILRSTNAPLLYTLPNSILPITNKQSTTWLDRLDMAFSPNTEESIRSSSNDTSASILTKAKTNPLLLSQPRSQFKPYQSMLSHIRSTHLDQSTQQPLEQQQQQQQQLENIKSLDGLTMGSKIDPFAKWCLFEAAGGVCRDNSCFSMHLRDISFNDKELLIDLCSYVCGETKEEQLAYVNHIVDILKTNGDNIKLMIEQILKFQSNYQPNDTTAVLFMKRNEQVKELLLTSSKITKTTTTATNTVTASINKETPFYVSIRPIMPPIQLSIMQRALDDDFNDYDTEEGNDTATGRYYSNDRLTSTEYETIITEQPERIEMWIAYAQHLLPHPLPVDLLRSPGTQLDDTLRILSRALSVHPTSEVLWNMYLELIMRRGDNDAVRNLVDHALQYTSMAWSIRWRYYLWEETVPKKRIILKEMTENLLLNTPEIDISQRSHRLLDIIMQIIVLVLTTGSADMAIITLYALLECKDEADLVLLIAGDKQLSKLPSLTIQPIDGGRKLVKLLTPIHLTLVITIYVHLLLWRQLPQDYLFYAAPNSFVTIDRLLLLRYDRLNNLPLSSELSSDCSNSLLGSVYLTWVALLKHLGAIKNRDNLKVNGTDQLLLAFIAAARNGLHLTKTFELSNQEIQDIVRKVAFNRWSDPALIELRLDIEPDLKHHTDILLDSIQQQTLEQHQCWSLNTSTKESRFKQMGTNFLYHRWIMAYITLNQDNDPKIRDELLVQLGNCVRCYFDEQSLSVSCDSPQQIGRLYRKLLGYPTSIDLISPREGISIASTRTDIYLWLNYLLFLQLTGVQSLNDTETTVNLFNEMITAIKSSPSSSNRMEYEWEGTLVVIWKIFIEWAIKHRSTGSISEQDKENKNLFIQKLLEQAIPQLTHSFVHLYNPVGNVTKANFIPLKDWTFVNELLNEYTLPSLSLSLSTGWKTIGPHLHYLLKDNVHYWRLLLYTMALEDTGETKKKRKKIERQLMGALSRFPWDQALWTMWAHFMINCIDVGTNCVISIH
ncbi:hypothetical protein BDF19DRAFT_442159 [Syncephalis fuscata]|nr:hypothetical protein BDF19DRAFT_442159 [Syncephalis fuscata]